MTQSGLTEHETAEAGPWNPGIQSTIPSRLLPLSTVFRADNVETSYDDALELADFSGLKPVQTVAFRFERLLVHELLVRVTADLSVPDGPEYEELGLNLRGMTARIRQAYVAPVEDQLAAQHAALVERAERYIEAELLAANGPLTLEAAPSTDKGGLFSRLFANLTTGPAEKPARVQSREDHLAARRSRWAGASDPFHTACGQALDFAVDAVLRTRGRLPADTAAIARLAINRFINTHCSEQIGLSLDPIVAEAAAQEGYKVLPAQSKPIVMNVKGASASGKSTLRPYQRELADKLDVPWESFALISPDYWRKYLLEYGSLGDDARYGAMLTGHELEIIDKKLDRYMAYKAQRGDMPHLLIDRFRFDSFLSGATDGSDATGSNLLTRFGHTIFMFFMVTPPAETVERAWRRGLTTGRFKAVDDLLNHNVEAYTGMPGLFFAWALSDKKVHYEFLGNDVREGERPRTIASGWNRRMRVFDVEGLLDIERFRRIDIEARDPAAVFSDGPIEMDEQSRFLARCCERLDQVQIADTNFDVETLPAEILQSASFAKRTAPEPDADFPDYRIGASGPARAQ
ncbi:hypothetical protein N9H93_05505 [Rhizobiaceae bacterium]|nr:hypothetical protein [Rhizobiaceae bacterium]